MIADRGRSLGNERRSDLGLLSGEVIVELRDDAQRPAIVSIGRMFSNLKGGLGCGVGRRWNWYEPDAGRRQQSAQGLDRGVFAARFDLVDAGLRSIYPVGECSLREPGM